MTNGWHVYKMGDLLTQNFNGVKVSPDKSYKLLGVRLEGRGAFLREEKSGGVISAGILNPVRAGDFIYSRLFAWRGAFGIVPEALDGCFVSGEFPTFTINTEKLSPKFLQLFFDRSVVWEEVETYCTGTTKASRNRFKERFFLGMEISIPSLNEQIRIVKHIDDIASRVAKARSLREETSQEEDILIYSAMRHIFDTQKIKNHLHLEKTCSAIIDNLHSNPDYSGDCVVPCIRSSDVGWGELFLHTARKTSEKEYQRRTVRGEPSENDIVLVREGGGTGKAALVGKNQRFSLGQRVMMLRPNPEIVLPKFLLYQLISNLSNVL